MFEDHILVAAGMAAIQDIEELFLLFFIEDLESQFSKKFILVEFFTIVGYFFALLADEGSKGADSFPSAFFEIKFEGFSCSEEQEVILQSFAGDADHLG